MGITDQKMDERLRISLTEMLRALSLALDCINPRLDSHQRRVCLIAMRIAGELRLAGLDQNALFAAALIHDLGAIAVKDRLGLLEFESYGAEFHAMLGAELLSRFGPFSSLESIVSFHHQPWLDGAGAEVDGVSVPIASHIIHLADRVEVMAQGSKNILAEAEQIRQRARDHRGSLFHPACVDAFLTISRADAFWLDILSPHLDDQLLALSPFTDIDVNLSQFAELARFFSLVIDSRSHFTATHSAGVAACAELLAGKLQCGAAIAKKLLVAGYLHDIGKLAIPSELLDANRRLTADEYAKVRTHSYMTYEILSRISGLDDIARWAGDHHERLDGSGYPRGLTARDLPLPSRIMSVSDVFTALTENRPYRIGMAPGEALAKMLTQATAGKLDLGVVECLASNIDLINQRVAQAQDNEARDLGNFWRLSKSRSKVSAPRRRNLPQRVESLALDQPALLV